MKSIKINLNNQTVYQSNPETLKEKGLMTTLLSRQKGEEQQETQIVLTILHKEENGVNGSPMDQHSLKVGDQITIWGTLGE